MKLKTLIHLVVFICGFAVLTFLLAVCISMCSCKRKGKEVKPGVYLDSAYSPAEAPLRIKTDTSTWIHRKCTPDRASHYITGGTKDSVDNYSGYNLNLLNKSDSVIIKQPGMSHAEWIYPLANGDTLRYGYAGIQKAGDFEIRKRIVRFGVDNNGIHRLLTTYEKD